jgi:1-deoxy-D-xylulose-5-phosphate synthase
MQPKDEDELADMLWTAIQIERPVFIRYPRGSAMGVTTKGEPSLLQIGTAEVVREGDAIQFWALGPWVAEAEAIAAEIARESGKSIGVVNARYAKPLDEDLLLKQARAADLIVTFEDHVIRGGFGSAVLECLSDNACQTPVLRIGYPDRFVDHGSNTADIRASAGIDRASVLKAIRRFEGNPQI